MDSRQLITLGTMALFIESASAAQWTVNPSGGANFTSLQAAIDFAQPGDVIVVSGGCYAGIIIDEPLTIVGTATIRRLSFPCSGSPIPDNCEGVACPALDIGPNASVVTLSGLTIDGRWDAGWIDSNSEPTVRCAPGTDVRLFDCTVTGPIAWQPTGTQPTNQPAIQAFGADLSLIRCTVSGGEHVVDTSDSAFWLSLLDVDGPPAIVGSDVLVLDSTVTGGPQGDYFMSPFDTNCPPSWPSGSNPAFHRGGTGIFATKLVHSNSTIHGGVGATITDVCSGTLTIYNQQPSGLPFVASSVTSLSHDLFSSNAPKIGQQWSATALFFGGTMILGVIEPDGLNVPVHGLLFLAPPTLLFFPGSSISTIVPSNTSLIGTAFSVQWISPTGQLSRPVFEVVRP